MDKTRKEALQVAKELTCKFIETRTVSPGNFAEVFPVVYRVVADTINQDLVLVKENGAEGPIEP